MNAGYNFNLSAAGLSIQSNTVVSGDTPNPLEVTIPKSKVGELTTRTDDDTGIVTSAAHGILDTDTVDLYDDSGLLIRKDMDVTAVTTDTISINAGSGANLPVLNAAVKITKQKVISPVFFDASGIQIFGIELAVPGATSEGRALFESSAPASVGDMELTANQGLISNVSAGAANPLSGDAASIKVSNGNSDLDGVLKIISMEDRTP